MLASDSVALVPLERKHLMKTREWANDPELMRLMDRVRPISEIEHENWYAKLHEQKTSLYFAVETVPEKKHVGNVWLWDIDWRHRRAEVRIVIGEKLTTGTGVGSETLQLITRYAFERFNLHKIYAYVLAINPRARRAFEKAGFSLEGTLKADRWTGDRYTDVYLLGKIA